VSSDCPTSPNGYPSDCEVLEGYRARVRDKSSREITPDRKRALARAKDIRLLLLDVDGVLTDGSLLYTGSGEESKAFNTQDGFGLRLLQDSGIGVGIITARKSEVVQRRATELKMGFIYQGAGNKRDAFKKIVADTGFKPFEIAYMGDDWLDLPLLQQVGLAVAPANAVNEVKDVAHFITDRSGGCGAVRDTCNLILEAKDLLSGLLQTYTNR
jgi:3-deoxy-D-manno-octulosonate 8-phosphate phosphatase (KDO 8-P phosphatase)